MPLIKLQTSLPRLDTAQAEALLKQLSTSLAQQTRKPESYVMTALEAAVPMTFGGSTEPSCYVEVKSVGSFSSEQTQVMSQRFCEQISAALGIPTTRIYIEFAEAKGHLWGWNGSTFG